MYKVTIQPGEQSFEVGEQENILEAGLRAGLPLPYSCRGGSCGSCAATVQSGELSYPKGAPPALTARDQEQGRALLCQAVAHSDLVLDNPRMAAEDELPVKMLPARVEKLRKLNHDVMEVTLKLPASQSLKFLAGQYVEVLLRDGKRRAFSVANAPSEDQSLELHIRHVPGGHFTTHVFDEMKERALLRIEAPLGTFYIRESERPLILVGGGTGFAPLKGIMEDLMAQGLDRPVHIYWGVRSKADLYMDDLPRGWAQRYDNVSYVPVLPDPQTEDAWEGRTGWVHDAVAEDFADLSAYDVYMSGPPPMIVAAQNAFREQGLPAEQLYSDSFEYSSDTLEALADEHEEKAG